MPSVVPRPSVVAVCVVHQLHPDCGSVGTTAIDKRPVNGAVRVRTLGLHGDVQADRRHHGGAEKAVYAYSQEDADFWAEELGRDLAPGWFGENLRTRGIDVSGARTGDRWLIGSGERAVHVEVTTPRLPCQTFARRVGGTDERGWVARFTRAGRPGAYLRVVRTGELRAGDEITVIATSDLDGPTISEMLQRTRY